MRGGHIAIPQHYWWGKVGAARAPLMQPGSLVFWDPRGSSFPRAAEPGGEQPWPLSLGFLPATWGWFSLGRRWDSGSVYRKHPESGRCSGAVPRRAAWRGWHPQEVGKRVPGQRMGTCECPVGPVRNPESWAWGWVVGGEVPRPEDCLVRLGRWPLRRRR